EPSSGANNNRRPHASSNVSLPALYPTPSRALTPNNNSSNPSSRPIPSRPAPNLPMRHTLNPPTIVTTAPGQLPTPLLPHRMPQYNNGFSQSASTGHLPGTISSGGTNNSNMLNSVTNGSNPNTPWIAFDPLFNQSQSGTIAPPIPPPKLTSLSGNLGHPTIPE
ncbi:unnamed protein product, partial [Trichobilharzia regenti]